MDRAIAMASGTMRWWRALCFVWPLLFVGPAGAHAQNAARSCSFICELEWKFEPTFTIETLANRHRVVGPDGVTERVKIELQANLAAMLKTAHAQITGASLAPLGRWEDERSPADDDLVQIMLVAGVRVGHGQRASLWLPPDVRSASD